MVKTTAKAQLNHLYTEGQATPVCTLDSPTWFAWLETATTFRYFSQQNLSMGHHCYLPFRPISLRKEKRRRGYLWYAYLKTHGCLHKRYVGKSSALTAARLEDIAAMLNQIW
jgi:LuxR family transcriptional regulator, maltose regulon positive regulatory protein